MATSSSAASNVLPIRNPINTVQPQSWGKWSVDSAIQTVFIGAVGVVFLYILYQIVYGSSKSHRDRSASDSFERRHVSASPALENVGCVIRISREALGFFDTSEKGQVQVVIDNSMGQHLAIRHVTIPRYDSHADIFSFLPQGQTVNLNFEVDSSYKPRPKRFDVGSAGGLYLIGSKEITREQLAKGRSVVSWIAGSTSRQAAGLSPMKFIIKSWGVEAALNDDPSSLTFENSTPNYQVVAVSIRSIYFGELNEPLYYPVDGNKTINVAINQIVKDWAAAYELKTRQQIPSQNLDPSRFSISTITPTAYQVY